MFATAARSLYRNFPKTLTKFPTNPPTITGYLVLTDEESEEMDTFCWGICKHSSIYKLPFPQDRVLKVVHNPEFGEPSVHKVWFLPVLDQPIASSRYYVIKAKGRHKGRAYTSWKEADMDSCCFDNSMNDLKPKPFNHKDTYQQFEICPYDLGGFYAKSVAYDGVPPKFLRKKGWHVNSIHSLKVNLREAQGLQLSTHPSDSDIPELNIPPSSKRSVPIIIGKWYCPCVLVKEGNIRTKEQMNKSLFYEVTLKCWWEQIFSCENEKRRNRAHVEVDARVRKLLTLIGGTEAVKDEEGSGGVVWFRVKEEFRNKCIVEKVGLNSVVIEKMRWIQERRGWFDGGESDVRVEGVEEIESENGYWRKFSCYVLVESFVFRRMDGSLLINFNFKNTQKIVCQWE
ncbi:hypothetical protein K7X08_018856 [Anisodus acutangulus]|uniref:Uncharacterized protein n=1 Tax=Anisodus acutangulus TaxID=402998 RepID=A0A9Q1M185_9SOLA|nr:hypothetical protein K7X08_018856 [Anisodus acutangulus]